MNCTQVKQSGGNLDEDIGKITSNWNGRKRQPLNLLNFYNGLVQL
jgi:hypothetical protein